LPGFAVFSLLDFLGKHEERELGIDWHTQPEAIDTVDNTILLEFTGRVGWLGFFALFLSCSGE
jgi:hypothetical protein